VATATIIGFLIHPNTPNTEAERKDVMAAAQSLSKQLIVVDLNSAEDILPAFTTLVERGADALLVGSGPFMVSYRKQIADLAARHSLPAVYHVRESVFSGGLMSYGTSVTEGYRQAGTYVARILKGEKPGDLPVVRSTKFDLVLNLNSAKALGITMPSALLATADEVIE
jgi:putative ABC transport system substrate-binding protein